MTDSKPAEDNSLQAENKATNINDNTNNSAPSNNSKVPKKSNKTLFIILGVVALLLIVVPAVLFFIIFGVVKDKVTDKSSNFVSGAINKATDGKVNVDASKGEVTIKGQNGDEITNKKTLPEGFPSSVKMYSPSTILVSYKSTTDAKTNWTVSLETPDSAAKVNESVKNTFAGWTLNGDYSSADSKVVSYEDPTYKLVITVGAPTKAGDKTTILYSVTQK